MNPNSFAFFALICWPLVTVFLYRSRSLVSATLWTVLGAQLLLPVGTFFKFEMIPLLDKNSIPSVCALIGCMVVARRPLKLWNRFGLTEILLVMVIVGPLITSLLNGDTIYVGDKVLPGVGPYDGLSAVLSQFVALIPFLVGRQFFRNRSDPKEVLQTLAIAGIAYSIPLLYEIRFSPQLHLWLYGYYPTDFIQTMREDGGFRPMVFMGHGLIAAFFAMTAAVASAALWHSQTRVLGVKPGSFAVYLSLVLILCKSGAALVYGVVLVPLVRWASPRLHLRVALLLVVLALLYPLLRIADIFPTGVLVETSRAVSEQRAGSLQYRFDQEAQLLDRASQRLTFGWGRYGRNRVYVQDYEGVGGDASVTDGRWIITLGQFGLFGFLAEFGLLALPVFRAAAAMKVVKSLNDGIFLGALALILAINLVDLLPNSALSSWTWLVAGSLIGCSEAILAGNRKQQQQRTAFQLSEAKIQAGGRAESRKWL